jgi:hypothetical protein
MNRSVAIVFCAAVVWATGLSDTTEAGLKRQKKRQTEISSSTRPAIREIIQDEKGEYFISGADYPQRAINLARSDVARSARILST